MNWKSPWVGVVLIWMVGLVAYANTFSGPFVFDDLVEISGNSALQNSDIAALFQRYPTRITTYLTLAAQYAVSGEKASSYHAVNILIHGLTATVIFFLVRQLTKGRDCEIVAGFTALLFVSHPIQTQAVTYTIQRLSSLTALLYFLGLLLYVLARRGKDWNWLYGGAWLSLLLAMFSKEVAFTAPLAILMVEWFFWDKSWRRAAAYFMLLPIIPVTLWLGGPPLVEREHPLVENAVVQPGRPLSTETDSISRRDYGLTQINAVRTYLRLLVLPIHQNVDYDYPISHSWLEAKTLASLALLGTMFGLGVLLYPQNRAASFGIFFFFLALSVESSFVPIRDVIFEHRLYLPSFGFFLAVAATVVAYLPRRVLVVTGGAVILALTGATVARNRVWQSEKTLWTDVVRKSPAKARGYNNLGVVYLKEGQDEKALPWFEAAIAREAGLAEAYNNLGTIKVRQGELEVALELFKKATSLEPLYTHAFNNLGVTYLKLGKPKEAIPPLEMAVGTDSLYHEAKINLDKARMLLDTMEL